MITRALITLSVISGLLLAGCNDGATDSTSASPDKPAAAYTSTPQATGTLVETADYSYRLPAEIEWTLGRSGQSAHAFDDDLNPYSIASFTVLLQAGNAGNDLDEGYSSGVDSTEYDPPLVRGENRVVDGIEGWTAETVVEGRVVYLFGTFHDRTAFQVTFDLQQKDPRSQAWIDAVLASMTWK